MSGQCHLGSSMPRLVYTNCRRSERLRRSTVVGAVVHVATSDRDELQVLWHSEVVVGNAAALN